MNTRAEMGRRGAARMRELAAEAERDRAKLLAELLADHATRHGRPATASERLPLEHIAIGTIRIRRLEARGRSSLEERRLVTQWWRAAGLKAEKPPPKPAETPLEYAQRKYGRSPVAPSEEVR